MTTTDTGAITEWPQSLVWAAFTTTTGAADALGEMQQADRNWLISIENAAVIVKNPDGTVEFSETEDRTSSGGMGTGAIIGGIIGMIFPPAFLASTAIGAAAGGIGAQMRDAGFEDNALRAAANELEPGQSALIAVIWHQWTDDVVRFLNAKAYRVGWAEITKEMAEAARTVRS